MPSLASELGFKIKRLKSKTKGIKYRVGYSERNGFKYFSGKLKRTKISGHLKDLKNRYAMILVLEGRLSIKLGKDDFVLDSIYNHLCFIDPSAETEYLIQEDVTFSRAYSQKENFESFLDKPISYYLNIPKSMTSRVAGCFGNCLLA